MNFVAGVDEVGRGALAGPVLAAAVILNSKQVVSGLTDSKLLTSNKRKDLSVFIKKKCIAWAIGLSFPEEIDQINILQASLLAMQRAINALSVKPHHVQVDGEFLPKVNCTIKGIIKGDILIPEISAASIIAKVARDEIMILYDKIYPEYGFVKHKGYGTSQHLLALRQFGIIPLHRRSFSPIKELVKCYVS